MRLGIQTVFGIGPMFGKPSTKRAAVYTQEGGNVGAGPALVYTLDCKPTTVFEFLSRSFGSHA